jgi:hypothetical protein
MDKVELRRKGEKLRVLKTSPDWISDVAPRMRWLQVTALKLIPRSLVSHINFIATIPPTEMA